MPEAYERTIPILGGAGYVKYIGHFGDDNLPLRAARMSTGNPTGVDARKDDALRSRLVRDVHASPFEFGALAIEARATLYMRSQIVRHRVLSFNEYSGRYSEMVDAFHSPEAAGIRGQSATNHQMSEGLIAPEAAREMAGAIASHTTAARQVYEGLLGEGMAREQARMVLPQNQLTTFMAQSNPRGWLSFLKLRLAPDVQPETRELAEAVARIFQDLWPRTWAVFEEHDISSVRLSKRQTEAVRHLVENGWADPHRQINTRLGEKEGADLIRRLGVKA